MARVAQLIEETVDCDFVDINMGCPIGKIFFLNITVPYFYCWRVEAGGGGGQEGPPLLIETVAGEKERKNKNF